MRQELWQEGESHLGHSLGCRCLHGLCKEGFDAHVAHMLALQQLDLQTPLPLKGPGQAVAASEPGCVLPVRPEQARIWLKTERWRPLSAGKAANCSRA